MIDELRKDNNRFTGARVLVSRFAFSLIKKIELILENVYGERLYNTTKGRRPTINDQRSTIHDSRSTDRGRGNRLQPPGFEFNSNISLNLAALGTGRNVVTTLARENVKCSGCIK